MLALSLRCLAYHQSWVFEQDDLGLVSKSHPVR